MHPIWLLTSFSEIDIEDSAFVAALESDTAACALNDTFGDGQSESVAVALGSERRTEDTRLDVFGNTGTVIGEGNLNLVVRIERIEHDDDVCVLTSLKRLQGVAQDIDEHLTYLFAVGINHHTTIRSDIADRYVLVVGTLKSDNVG